MTLHKTLTCISALFIVLAIACSTKSKSSVNTKQDARDNVGENPIGRGVGGVLKPGISIGGGLAGRRVVRQGQMNDTHKKQGRVVIAVCVDSDGRVVSADYKLSGSTTSDSELKDKAIAAAKAYRFGAASISQECGTITFNFKLK